MDIFCSVLHLHQKKTWMRTGFWDMTDGSPQPTRAGMLRATRPLLWRYWLSSGESGFVLILMTAEETAAHLCGPPDTWSRGRDAPLAAAKTGREGHTEHMNLSPRARASRTWTSPSFVSARAEVCFTVGEAENWLLINCVTNKKTTHCWLALCCALGLARHWSGALDGNIGTTHCFQRGYHA